MTDLEGITLKLLKVGKNESEIIEYLQGQIEFYKGEDYQISKSMAKAILSEVRKSRQKRDSFEQKLLLTLLNTPQSDITMQTGGVGCRGEGDFKVHQKLASLAATVDATLGVKDLDDAGVIKIEEEGIKYIISKIEGMHSRLSEFPFLAGFHVTRAALRDIFVKGGEPEALMIDLHLGDDGDIGKLLDFVAGCATISKLTNVPIITGSTLRIGGDMVIGTRLTGCVAAVGTVTKILPRKNLKPGQIMIMTRGAGGGTITTAAIYSGNHHIIKHTINLNFINAVKSLRRKKLYDKVDCMIDVTNGGVRNELNESINSLNCGIEINKSIFQSLIHPEVLDLLNLMNIDPLGVSIGSLLIFCQPEIMKEVLTTFKADNIPAGVAGRVISEKGLFILNEKGIREKISVRKRESAYTEVKKTVENQELNLTGLEKAWKQAKKKIDLVCQYITDTHV
ncbi:MAG: AIR synthase related protein [Promethearchaeota archaeon]